MEIRKEDVAMDIVRWIARHGITTYVNMITINVDPNDSRDSQELLDLIGRYNTIVNTESKIDNE